MKINFNHNMANEIAQIIIDKSFWGNEWFVLFSMLLVGLTAALCAWAGSYLSTRSQNSAIRADFEKALKNLEKQTKSIKMIEEGIAHDFLEKREFLKIRREKIEELYLALSAELDLLGNNLTIAATDDFRNQVVPVNRVEMLLSLYFKEEMENELNFYLEQKKAIVTRIRQLSEENLDGTCVISKDRVKENLVFFKNLNQAKINIELALEKQMNNLTKK